MRKSWNFRIVRMVLVRLALSLVSAHATQNTAPGAANVPAAQIHALKVTMLSTMLVGTRRESGSGDSPRWWKPPVTVFYSIPEATPILSSKTRAT